MQAISLPDGWKLRTKPILNMETFCGEYGVMVINEELNKRQAVAVRSQHGDITEQEAIKDALPKLIEWIETQK